MKAILEFNLPEDKDEHEDAINGWKWRYVVTEFDNVLRGRIKHGQHTEEEYRTYEELRGLIREMLLDEGLTLG